MKSQWDCVLQNLGEWQGSFTHLSSQGDVREDIPSVISLEGVNNNQAIHLVLKRFYPLQPGSSEVRPDELVRDFSSLGAGTLFFESGAFSEGSTYFSTSVRFGAEFGFMAPVLQSGGRSDRRMRLVQLFNPSSQLYQLTLIREKRTGTDAPEHSPLVLDDLIGEWQGNAVTLYPDMLSPAIHTTMFALSRQSETQLVQQFFSHEDDAIHTATATSNGSVFSFSHDEQPYQTLLLPDGASSTCPIQIHPGQPFFLEVGWLLQPGLRQRMIRHYDSAGNWTSLTLAQETLVAQN